MLVPERARKCVCFLGIKEREHFRPRATAFAVEIFDQGGRWKYLVTAEHVVSGLLSKNHEVWLRINNVNSGPDEIKIQPSDWWYHPNSEEAKTDVVVCPIDLDAVADISPVPISGPESVAATRQVIDEINIGVGDEIIVTGLFRSHYGRQRNIPIVRVGNIAMLDGDPVRTDYCGYTDGYLIEARSIGGLSGSPAFVHIPAIRTVQGKTKLHGGKRIFQLYLLGLVHGHFDVDDLNSDVVLEDPKDSTSGIHSGIAVVIPVEKIIETIMQPDLVEIRRQIAQAEKDSSAGIDPVRTGN
jgi:hypothetical protein